MESLHKQVLPFLLRRLKEDVLSDLPPKIIQDYYCDLSPLQQDLYEEYGQTGETAADGVADTGAPTHVFQTLQHLKKLVNHPSLVLEPENPKHQAILVKNRIKDPSSDLRGIEQAPKLLALRYACKREIPFEGLTSYEGSYCRTMALGRTYQNQTRSPKMTFSKLLSRLTACSSFVRRRSC